MSIGIGITTYNDYYMTNQLLDSIFIYTDRKEIDKILVLDDGSDSDYREMLRKVCDAHSVGMISNSENIGVPRSWNRLVRDVGTDYIILLNNDIVVWKGWFKCMKYALENNSNSDDQNNSIGTISLPTYIIDKKDIHRVIELPNKRHIEILKPTNKMVRSGCVAIPESRDPVRVINPIGCSFGFSRKMYEKCLGFNEIYKYFYEEVDFGISLHGMKHGNIVLPGPHIYHVWGATFVDNYSGVGEKRIDAQRVMSESRKKFIEKYGHDQTEMFRLLDHNFDTKVKYLGWNGGDGENGNWVEKEVILRETYSPDCGIEW